MARQCSICSHVNRNEIEEKLVNGFSYSELVEEFGLSKASLSRHRNAHVEDFHSPTEELQILKNEFKAIQKLASAGGTQGRVNVLVETLASLLESALASGNMRQALATVRETRQCLELIARLTGEMVKEAEPPSIVPMFNLPPGTKVQLTVNREEAIEVNSTPLPPRLESVNSQGV